VLTETPSPALYARDPWSSRLELSHLGFGIVHSAHRLPNFSAAPPIDPLLVLPFLVLNAGKPPHECYTLVILGLPAWSPTFCLGFGIVHGVLCLPDFSAAPPDEPLSVQPTSHWTLSIID